MQYYPIFLRVKGKRCLVVGGGEIAHFKARWLLKAGAHVIAVSPSFVRDFDNLPELERIERMFHVEDLEGVRLAISATGDPECNAVFRDACEKNGVFYCVTDDPEQCEFFLPSAFERGDLTVAISTGGASPALSKRLRRELEGWLPEDFANYVAFLRRARDLSRARIADRQVRSRISNYLASRQGYEEYMSLDTDAREAWLERLLSEQDPH